jgi:hypothetical protein
MEVMMAHSRSEPAPSRLRVFRESDFADEDAPTLPGAQALARGTGSLARQAIQAATDDFSNEVTEPHYVPRIR